MKRNLNFRALGAIAILSVMPANVSVGADISPEAIKATYIIQMQNFITVGNPLHKINKICYYEKQLTPPSESVGQQLEEYVRTHNKNELPTIKRFEAIGDFSGCDILYIPATNESNIENIITARGLSETVTVSSVQRFILRGGMIGFVMDEENRVKLEANLKNAKEKNIHIDAQLLEIMQRVLN